MANDNQSSYRKEVKRKLFHLSSIWMLAAIYFLDSQQAVGFFALLSICLICFELARRNSRLVRFITGKHMRFMMRTHEVNKKTQHLTGAFYFSIAVFCSVLFFTKEVALVAVAIMIFADTAAALVGRRFGRHKILDKSLEGAAAFFVVSASILACSSSIGLVDIRTYDVVVIGLGATLVELFSKQLKIDDNFSIVMAAAALIFMAL